MTQQISIEAPMPATASPTALGRFRVLLRILVPAALIIGSYSVAALASRGAGASSVRATTVASKLIGMWLGPPVPAQSSSCGSAYSQWRFTAKGQFRLIMATSNCGGYDVSGIYSVTHGNALSERITNTGTPYAPPKPFVAGKVTFVTANDFRILDGGFTYTFHRQHP
jgi:hypothetical protein